jgi:hypothetical protein
MIEIFTTNVTEKNQAERVLNKIRSAFPGYKVNFDLDDCDHILRIDSRGSVLCAATLIQLVHQLGFRAEILPDEIIIEDFA